LRVTHRPYGPDVIVTLEGEVDVYTAPALRTELTALIPVARNLVVDCTRMAWIDATGLAVLIGVFKKLRATPGRSLYLAVPEGAPPRKVLARMGLDRVFSLCPTLDQALAAAAGPPAAAS
jgi:anti-sigma B factor antagonist